MRIPTEIHFRPHAPIALLAVCVVFGSATIAKAATVASAQDAPSAPITSPSSPAKPASRSPASPTSGQGATAFTDLRLSLSDAVRMAFENNLEILVVDFDQEMAEQAVVAARGQFDPTFYVGLPQANTLIPPAVGGGFGGGPTGAGGLGFSSSDQPATSQLFGADVSSSDSLATLVDFGQQLKNGLRWDLGYSITRGVSNSIFNSLNPAYSNTLTLSLVQPLLRGAGKANTANLRLAQRNTDVSGAAFRTQVETVLLQVEQAYWNLVFTERDQQVKQQSLDLALEQLERTKAQVEVGLIAPVQQTQAEVAVASREAEIIAARNNVESAADQLRGLLRAETLPKGWDTPVVATDEPSVATTDIDLDHAIASALQNRPELRQAGASIAARRVEVEANRNALLPRVDLVGAISVAGIGGDRIERSGFPFGDVIGIEEGGYGDAVDQLLSLNFRTWRIGVNVTYPLLNRTAKGNYARATIAEDRAKVEHERVRQQIVLEVRQAARERLATAEQLVAITKARELAERQLEIEQDRFGVGMTTNFEVLEFQEDLAEARTNELRAMIDSRVADAQMSRATGTLLQRFGLDVVADRGASDSRSTVLGSRR